MLVMLAFYQVYASSPSNYQNTWNMKITELGPKLHKGETHKVPLLIESNQSVISKIQDHDQNLHKRPKSALLQSFLQVLVNKINVGQTSEFWPIHENSQPFWNLNLVTVAEKLAHVNGRSQKSLVSFSFDFSLSLSLDFLWNSSSPCT